MSTPNTVYYRLGHGAGKETFGCQGLGRRKYCPHILTQLRDESLNTGGVLLVPKADFDKTFLNRACPL
jgi:hypothetical protein